MKPEELNKLGKVYHAGPWFNDEQFERNEAITKALRDLGYEVFAPKDETLVVPDADADWREQSFKGNVDAIDDSSFVLACTDGKDVGTIFEAGYAYAKGIPVVYFAETLGDNQFNLMLAQSGIHVITSREQLEKDLANSELINKLSEGKKFSSYEGSIE